MPCKRFAVADAGHDKLHPPPVSHFAAVPPGDGWSSRAEDAILHGCIPVVIMDNVHAVFESILDWDLFSIRIKEGMLEHLPQVSRSA